MKNSLRFTVPVVMENIVTVAVSLIYSSLTGAISKSSLAASGVGNQAMSLIATFMNVFICGSTILVARETGKGEKDTAARTAEHALLFTPILSAVTMVLLLIATPVLMKILMPGAEESFLKEGTLYFRMMLYSLPGLAMFSMLCGVLRASGDSRAALMGTIVSCGVQLVTVWLFTSRMHMGIAGAAGATIASRYASALYLLYVLIRHNRAFAINVKRIFSPTAELLRRMCAVGLPNTFDALAVQIGYVAINSILVSMGTLSASVVNVLNAVWLLGGICQLIGTNMTTTLTGHLIGAGNIPAARKCVLHIFAVTETITFLLTLPTAFIAPRIATFFASDPEVLAESARVMWLLIPLGFVAVGCNVIEPSTRVGGEVRFTMTEIICCVLLLRLPLTYILCYMFDFGVYGIYAANIFSLFVRVAVSFARLMSDKWGRRQI